MELLIGVAEFLFSILKIAMAKIQNYDLADFDKEITGWIHQCL